jgi:hypothetical protein
VAEFEGVGGVAEEHGGKRSESRGKGNH